MTQMEQDTERTQGSVEESEAVIESSGSDLLPEREVNAEDVVQQAEQLLRDGHDADFDVIVIGGGPGGCSAAIRAAQLGGNVALIERDALGGACLNRGCIPTKALLEGAQLLRTLKRSHEMGIMTGSVSLDYPTLLQWMHRSIKHLRTGLEFLFEKNCVTVMRGEAVLEAPHKVTVSFPDGSKRSLVATGVIIAVGSEPARPAIPGIDSTGVVSSDDLLDITSPPKVMVIIGGGCVGVEFASMFQDLGTHVTLVEMLPTILPSEDRDISAEVTRLFESRGITIVTGARVVRMSRDGDSVRVFYERSPVTEEASGNCILVAVGRKSDTDRLGLKAVGIECDGSHVIVDTRMETNLRGVFAVGDALRGAGLAHTAMAEGSVAGENAMGGNREIERDLIPTCIYGYPEVASAGLTEHEAEKEDYPIRSGRFPFRASARAATTGEEEGFVKVVVRDDDETIIGVHIIGPRATDLIAEAVLVLKFGMTVSELANTIHAHPSFAEAIVEAALAARAGNG